MRSLAVLAVFLLAAAPVWADGAPIARVQAPTDRAPFDAALETAGGIGASLATRAPVAPRVIVPTPGGITFGFQGATEGSLARIAPRPVVTPSAFQGFGGFAARVRTDAVGVEQPLLPVSDFVEDGACCDADACDTDLEVDACGRVYERTRPSETTYKSSYYVPTYRRYVGTTSASDCDPCVQRRVVRRYVRPAYSCYTPCYDPCYRPYVRSCYTPYYGSCYRPYYRSCGWGPYWGGFGLGVGLGVGIGWASGCW